MPIRQFESVANRIFADFYKNFAAHGAKISKKTKIKNAGFPVVFLKNIWCVEKIRNNCEKMLDFFRI